MHEKFASPLSEPYMLGYVRQLAAKEFLSV